MTFALHLGRTRHLVCWILLASSVSLFTSEAKACGGIFDVQCNLEHGGLSPGNIADQAGKAADDVARNVAKAGQDVANAVNELQASTLSGPALEQAIISSRNSAANGSMPIPAYIRQQLTGYSTEETMNRVRYKIGDNGFFNLARLLEQGGFASAVTLDDVIVFIGPSEANNPSIWAHELHHVEQYREWGVHSFAVQYARNAGGVENPAYDKGNGYWAWAQQRQAASGQQGQSFPPMPMPMPQPLLGAFCYTAGGRFGPGPIQPQGSPCFVDFPQGRSFGQIGP